MPSVSSKQRQAMAIAKNNPRKLYKRNRGMAKMDQGDLHDFASTSEEGLPTYAENIKQAARRKKR